MEGKEETHDLCCADNPHPKTSLQEERQKDGRLEMLGQVDRAIERGLRAMAEAAANNSTVSEQNESLLSGAMGRGLLYIKRKETEDVLGKKLQARLMVLKISCESSFFPVLWSCKHFLFSCFEGLCIPLLLMLHPPLLS